MITRLLAVAAWLLAPSVAGSSPSLTDDFFVDVTNGDDVQGDGSSGSPWKTIRHATTQVQDNGDRIIVRPGTHDASTGEAFPLFLTPGVSLISEQGPEVTSIVGQPDRDVVVVTGSQNRPSNLEGFTIQGGVGGVRCAGGSQQTQLIRNNTISGNVEGIKTTPSGGGDWRIEDNRITLNGTGWYHRGGGGWFVTDCDISGNTQDGVRIRSGAQLSITTRDLEIRANGGRGWDQLAFGYGNVTATLVNTTISANGSGGISTLADQYSYYWPGYGYLTRDPVAQMNIAHSVLYGNGGFGGAQYGGTSAKAQGDLLASISWGNAGSDNVNFGAQSSDIGTGSNGGPGNISADPKFVNGPGGDFRLRHDSPCIDQIAGAPYLNADFEGEHRPFDGDSDGVASSDMGADEFGTLIAPGVTPVSGQPFHFEAFAPPAEEGFLALVLLSGSPADSGGGVPLPGSGGLELDLASDALFQFGLAFLPLFQTTITNGQGQTPNVTIPATFSGTVYFAGVSIDLVNGSYGTVTPTRSLSVTGP